MSLRQHMGRQARPIIETLDARLLFKTLFVDANGPAGTGSSWVSPIQSLQQAITLAVPGDKIRVADGVYTPTNTGDRAASFSLKNAVEILGGFAGFGAPDPNLRDPQTFPTILSGDIGTAGTQTDNSLHVVTANNVSSTSILDGFTITGGYALGGSGGSNIDRGGGMLVLNASPTIKNCTISNNRAHIYGEGVYVAGNPAVGTSTAPQFTDCRFVNNGSSTALNSWGGAMYCEFAAPVITGCTFTGNATYLGAGAIHTTRSSPVIANSTFSGNWGRYGGAAISFEQGTNGNVSNCTFTGNTTELAGTVVNRGSSMYATMSKFTDCTFVGNTGGNGGAVYNDSGATFTADRCTFIDNTAETSGGAVWSWMGKISLTNSWFYGNGVVPRWPGGTAEGGAVANGAYDMGRRAFIANCEFVGNHTPGKGGAVADLGPFGADIYGSTFIANTAANTGGAVYSSNGSEKALVVANSILRANTAPTGPQITALGPALSVRWSNVQGWPVSAIMIDADAVFVRDPSAGGDSAWGTSDDDYGDLRLQPQSPCVDAGSFADASPNYPTDIDGLPRTFDFPGVDPARPAPDMGAHELGLTLGLLRIPAGQSLWLGEEGYTFVVEQFELGNGATLDLANNAMILQGADFTAVQDMVTTGFNGGMWNGSGINSSAAATDPNGFTALGVVDNADLGATEFGGVPGLTGDEVLVKYTYYGDADLSGAVTLDDYSQFLAGFQNPSTAQWSVGDFDYSGTVTLDDYSVFLLVFQNQGIPL